MSVRSLLAALPQVLTVATLGAAPLFSHSQEYPARPLALVVPFAPGGGADSIARDIARDSALIGEAAASTKVRSRLTSEGAEAINVSPAQFGRALASELDSWRNVVKSTGIKL